MPRFAFCSLCYLMLCEALFSNSVFVAFQPGDIFYALYVLSKEISLG